MMKFLNPVSIGPKLAHLREPDVLRTDDSATNGMKPRGAEASAAMRRQSRAAALSLNS